MYIATDHHSTVSALRFVPVHGHETLMGDGVARYSQIISARPAAGFGFGSRDESERITQGIQGLLFFGRDVLDGIRVPNCNLFAPRRNNMQQNGYTSDVAALTDLAGTPTWARFLQTMQPPARVALDQIIAECERSFNSRRVRCYPEEYGYNADHITKALSVVWADKPEWDARFMIAEKLLYEGRGDMSDDSPDSDYQIAYRKTLRWLSLPEPAQALASQFLYSRIAPCLKGPEDSINAVVKAFDALLRSDMPSTAMADAIRAFSRNPTRLPASYEPPVASSASGWLAGTFKNLQKRFVVDIEINPKGTLEAMAPHLVADYLAITSGLWAKGMLSPQATSGYTQWVRNVEHLMRGNDFNSNFK